MIPKPIKVPKVRKPVRKRKKGKRANLMLKADKLWSALVKRSGHCEFAADGLYPEAYPHKCAGPLQAQHGIPRTFHATRWVLINGFCGCKSSHLFWTHRQALWGLFLAKAWGSLVADELWRIARNHEVPDLEVVVQKLRLAQFPPDPSLTRSEVVAPIQVDPKEYGFQEHNFS